MRLKKTTIICSFLLITVFSVGNYVLHLVYLENYKKDFKEYIIKHKNESVLTNIDVKANELYVNSTSISWEDSNQEIIYKDKLYDVITIQHHGDKVTITVVSDDQEMTLKKEFASTYDVSSRSTSKGPFELLKNFLTLKYLVTTSEINFSYTSIHCISQTTNPTFFITSVVINLDTPPPDSFI